MLVCTYLHDFSVYGPEPERSILGPSNKLKVVLGPLPPHKLFDHVGVSLKRLHEIPFCIHLQCRVTSLGQTQDPLPERQIPRPPHRICRLDT